MKGGHECHRQVSVPLVSLLRWFRWFYQLSCSVLVLFRGRRTQSTGDFCARVQFRGRRAIRYIYREVSPSQRYDGAGEIAERYI